jgi:hypothetical protein
MKIDPNIAAKVPAEDLQALLQIASRLAVSGVDLRLAVAKSAVRSRAGKASAEARTAKFGSADPRNNVNKTGTSDPKQCEQNGNSPPVNIVNKREQNVNKTGGVGGGSLSLISDQRSEDQRESAREARAQKPKAPKVKATTWRRVPGDWQPTDQHRQIATDCCVPFDLELAKFRDHEFSVPKRDPDAAFRNWLRNARKSTPFPVAPPRPASHASRTDIDRMLGLA